MDSPVKKTIMLTGSGGQLGFHTRARLQHHFGFDVIAVDRTVFNDPEALELAVSRSDSIVHLAGVNRGTDSEIEAGNPDIASKLINACKATNFQSQIIYASTIHVQKDTIYGNSKRRAGEILSAYCASNNAIFSEIILPNLFGEFSRPNYNNFAGTFCHQIINGIAPSIHQDATLQLLSYRDAADVIAKIIIDNTAGQVIPTGETTSVKAVADILESQFDDYKNGVIPDLRDDFKLDIFNMLRSSMFETQFPVFLTRHADARGSFFECIRSKNSGQTSFSTTVPNITRGDHFHFKKVERFLVLSGNARISLRRIFDNKRIDFDVSGDKPCYVDMPTYYTHSITNIGQSELLTLFWTHDFFDPNNTDTYVEAV